MTPKPWSHSALEQFKNCPRAYHAHRVDKSVPYVEGPEAAYGNMVHKAFEDRVRDGKPLPADLQLHETYLARLASLPGQIYVEREIAVNRKLQPCGYWDEDVWYRAKIDYLNINDGRARIVDYKTGKPHQKLLQLFEYILFTMIVFPEVETAYAEYYWTKAPECPTGTGGAWPRERVLKETWPMLLPDLKQMAEAYKLDVWQPRPSGLCKRHCAVTDCEFNGLGNRR
jgi:hypothetical protein